MTVPPFESIGKFRITDLIGEGAMGVVYRAHDPVLNRYVAVKLMGTGLSKDEQLRDRVLREAQAAASLQHPNVVTVFDCGEVEDHLYIAMEYVEGADLEEIIHRRDPLPLHLKLDIISDVLKGLAYAHSRGVVHRDIKPANIRVTEDGRGKLMDFGIAHLADSNLTQSGVMVGTPHYMAPEQITGGKITPSTDLFAVGTVAYELLSNAKPFTGETLHSVLFKVVDEEPPPLDQLVPGLPVKLRDIVAKAMAKKPAQRYHSATEMDREVTAVRAEISEGTAGPTVIRRTPLQTLPPTAAIRRRRRRWILSTATLIVAVGATGWFLGPWRGEGRSFVTTAGVEGTAGAQVVPDTGPVRPGDAVPADSPTAPAVAARDSEPPITRTREQAAAEPPTEPAARRPAPTPDTAPAREEPAAPEPAEPRPRPAAAADTVVADTTPAEAEDTTPPPVLEPPAPAAPPPDTTPEPVERAEAAAARLIAAYADAVEARDLGRLREIYVGMTEDQETGWRGFFDAARNIEARLEVGQMEVSGDEARAVVTGSYEYDNRITGASGSQPVEFRITLRRTAGAWHLVTVH